jgi:hypothetical protein
VVGEWWSSLGAKRVYYTHGVMDIRGDGTLLPKMFVIHKLWLIWCVNHEGEWLVRVRDMYLQNSFASVDESHHPVRYLKRRGCCNLAQEAYSHVQPLSSRVTTHAKTFKSR